MKYKIGQQNAVFFSYCRNAHKTAVPCHPVPNRHVQLAVRFLQHAFATSHKTACDQKRVSSRRCDSDAQESKISARPRKKKIVTFHSSFFKKHASLSSSFIYYFQAFPGLPFPSPFTDMPICACAQPKLPFLLSSGGVVPRKSCSYPLYDQFSYADLSELSSSPQNNVFIVIIIIYMITILYPHNWWHRNEGYATKKFGEWR